MSTHIKKKRLYEIPFLRILIMSTKGGKKKKKSVDQNFSSFLWEREKGSMEMGKNMFFDFSSIKKKL